MACGIGVELIRDLMEYSRPGESVRNAKWFLESINPTLERLGSISVSQPPVDGPGPKGHLIIKGMTRGMSQVMCAPRGRYSDGLAEMRG